MEEILEEHALERIKELGVGRAETRENVPSNGQRLGGNENGKSRLLGDWDVGPGRTLGGLSRSLSPTSLREARVKAAESRRRIMDQTRRHIAKAKEPCVIEILDDAQEDAPDRKRVKRQEFKGLARNQPDEVIDLTATPQKASPPPSNENWSCRHCTFQNLPLALVCNICLSERSCDER